MRANQTVSEKASSYWNKQSGRYDKATQLLSFDLESLVKDVANLIPEKSKVFEAGCGTGLFTIAAASRADRVIATDVSKNMIEVTKLRLRDHNLRNVHLSMADALMIDSFKGPFEVVLCANLLHLLNEPEEFLKKAISRLKPGPADRSDISSQRKPICPRSECYIEVLGISFSSFLPSRELSESL